MKLVAKILLASAFALSAVVPAFAAEEDTLMERGGVMSAGNAYAQQMVKHAHSRHVTSHRAYVPVSTPTGDVIDFSIGSQR